MAKKYSAQKWESLKDATKPGKQGRSTPSQNQQGRMAPGKHVPGPKAQPMKGNPRSTPSKNMPIKWAPGKGK